MPPAGDRLRGEESNGQAGDAQQALLLPEERETGQAVKSQLEEQATVAERQPRSQ
jgi:hypothetical protein